ncbi:MAG: hypothetical protein V1494_04940 [Candidatus Diapherotrites archaeon]
MIFVDSFRDYLANFKAALSFVLLLILAFVLVQLSNSFVSAGSILADYGFIKSMPAELAALAATTLVFLFFYSIFVTLIVFAVRRELSTVKVNYYLREKIRLFAFKYFRFLLVFTFIAAVGASLLVNAGVSEAIASLVIFVFSLLFLFLPQAIVIDEEGVRASILNNLEFMYKNPLAVLELLVTGFVLVFILLVLEFLLDLFFSIGAYAALLISLVFLIPFLEVLKTELYMRKFTLITGSRRMELLAARH